MRLLQYSGTMKGESLQQGRVGHGRGKLWSAGYKLANG